jgi:hypothetical protein
MSDDPDAVARVILATTSPDPDDADSNDRELRGTRT